MEFTQPRQVPLAALPRQVIEDGYLVSSLDQAMGEIGADETGTAGDECVQISSFARGLLDWDEGNG
jgi:hypothetical protein